MKKLTAVVLILALSLFAAAMAEADNFTGTWYLNEMTVGETAISPASMGMDLTMEINADGTAVLRAPGMDDAEQAGTWTLDGDTITLTIEGDEMTLSLQDGALVGEQGGMGMNFGREKIEVETYEPAAVRTDAAEADFAGAWQAAFIKFEDSYMPISLLGMDMTADIEGTEITLNGMYVFEDLKLPASFADGALNFEGSDQDLYAAIKAELLEDGAMLMTLETGDDPLVIVLQKAA